MKKTIGIILLTILLQAGRVYAIEPLPLPLFTVQTTSNTFVESDRLTQESRWLLLYLSDGCTHCNDLFHALEIFEGLPFSDRVVIVVGGANSETLSGLISSREKMATLGWYADPDRQAYKILPISGTPVVFGIRDGVIEWSMSGTPGDSETIQSILADWVNY